MANDLYRRVKNYEAHKEGLESSLRQFKNVSQTDLEDLNYQTGQVIQKLRGIDFELRNEITRSFDLIVNMSPVGMGSLKDQSPIPLSGLYHLDTIVYDLIYNPAQTMLLKEANSSGLTTINGLPMLIGQAEESFKIWTGRNFPEEVKRGLENYL